MDFKIGIIKEGKIPPDKRVALTPKQCLYIMEQYPNVKIAVQPSPIRSFNDQEYSDLGIEIKDDLSDCDILLGIKEVPINELIPEKTYFFFSHTIKLQPYNRNLLKAILKKNIKLVDYEVITTIDNRRLIGFGRYAGIVGGYNAFLAVGKKFNLFDLKPANQFVDISEMQEQIEKIKLPPNFKIVITGDGRVAGGALETLDKLNLLLVSPEEFLEKEFTEPVYTRLRSKDFYHEKTGKPWNTFDFYNHSENYVSNFARYTKVADLYLACHYWNPKADVIFREEDMKSRDFSLKVIADISCDIKGPIPSTIRASTIAEPLYGYDRQNDIEIPFTDEKAICVMAVDNLPCELPRDASEDFGDEFIKFVLPNLIGEDTDSIIKRAVIAEKGALTEKYHYMKSLIE
jgi:saccharopine dehydrogenase (NAD+, L-lysine-forming)